MAIQIDELYEELDAQRAMHADVLGMHASDDFVKHVNNLSNSKERIVILRSIQKLQSTFTDLLRRQHVECDVGRAV